MLAFWQFSIQKIFRVPILGIAENLPTGSMVVYASTGHFLRPIGTFGHANILGAFLVIGTLVGFGLLLMTSKKVIPRLLLLISTAVLSMGIVITFSRSAWLAFSIALFIIFLVSFTAWLKPFRRSILFFLLIIVISSLSVAAIIPDIIGARFSNDLLPAAQVRQSYSSEANQLLSSHPIRGIGIGQYALGVHNLIDSSRSGGQYQPVHNIPKLIWVELGLGGIAIFTFMFIFIGHCLIRDLRVNARNKFRPADYRPLWFFTFGLGVIILFFLSLFDHYLWTDNSSFYLFSC